MYVIEVIVEPTAHPAFKVREALDRLKDFFVVNQDRVTSQMSDSFSCEIDAYIHGNNGMKLTLSLIDYEQPSASQEQLDSLTTATRTAFIEDFPSHLGITSNDVTVLAHGYAEIDAVA